MYRDMSLTPGQICKPGNNLSCCLVIYCQAVLCICQAVLCIMPNVAARGGHILKIDLFCWKHCEVSGGKRKKSVATRKPKGKGKCAKSPPSSADESSSTPAHGKLSTLADALADALSEIEAQSSSAGNESVQYETSAAVSQAMQR